MGGKIWGYLQREANECKRGSAQLAGDDPANLG